MTKLPAKNLFFLLFILSGLIFLTIINRHVYYEEFNFEKTAEIFSRSQFAPNIKNRQTMIQDWDLYSYAGIKYLTSGQLDSVNAEHPPLGKYLFGTAYFLVKRPVLAQIPLAFIFLWLSFLISKKVLKNSWLSLCVPFFILIEPLFHIQLTHSMLDLSLAAAIAAFLWIAVNKAEKTRGKHFILGLILGVSASIKFPAAAFILSLVYFISVFKINRLFLKKIIIVSTSCLLVYLLTYSPLIIKKGASAFFAVHVRAAKIHLSHVPGYPAFAPIKTMLFNRWPVWWDEKNPDWKVQERLITWPLLALTSLASPLVFLKYRKQQNKNLVIFSFFWLYFIFINLRLFFPGYLLLILPYFYMIAIWELSILLKIFYKR